jgi:hypothetical protein
LSCPAKPSFYVTQDGRFENSLCCTAKALINQKLVNQCFGVAVQFSLRNKIALMRLVFSQKRIILHKKLK